MPIRKPWTAWDDSIRARSLPGAMGVYELADEDQNLIYIGKAGGRSRFGIRGELFRHFSTRERLACENWMHPEMGQDLPSLKGKARFYRYEVNHQYHSRWIELLTRFREDHECLPQANLEDPEQPPTLGRYHWKSEAL